MDRNTMKNTMKTLKLWVLGCVMLFAGVQSASAALTGCEGTVYFKLPDGWKSAYAVAGGQKAVFSKSTYSGWLQVSTTAIGAQNGVTGFVIEETGANDCNSGHCARKDSMDVKFMQLSDNGVHAFTCKDFGSEGELWISAHPDPAKVNVTYYSANPPDVKFFYVFLPDNKIWKSSDPIIVEDGKEKKLDIDKDNCGWYFRRYINEALPTKVFVRRDDDEALTNAIGMGGEKSANEGLAPEEIDLDGLFDTFKNDADYENALYFVADEKKASELTGFQFGWYLKRPAITGNCSYNLAARIYDTDASLHPAFSCYGGPSDPKPHDPNPDHDACQLVNQTNAAAGANKAAALKAIYECIGVTPGIVESTLDPTTKKPKLSSAGKKCFMDDKYFDMLFTHVEGVNEVTCFDMPFTRADDGKWEFDSDFFTSPGLDTPVQGGFYPAEATTALKVKEADSTQTELPAARTKRGAEGPVFYGPTLREVDNATGMPKIDILCNGPGWTGGNKCDGLFADGEGTETFYQGLSLANKDACVFGWSCPDKAPAGWAFFVDGTETSAASGSPRWSSKEKSEDPKTVNGGRNQHFCFESHAEFRFKPGLKFNFRGDDDIWVYIDNKLAVDLGGTHLAAPAYVDLDKFMPNAKTDSTYDIDIFFCDRRTTMSNVRIKTNMFIEQNVGIKAEGHQNSNEDFKATGGNNKFKLKYSQSGGGSCAAARGTATVLEGKAITDAGYKITYQLTTDKSGSDPTATKISEEEFEANPIQLDGIIDVSEPGEPMINEIKLKKVLPPGTWYLRIKIGTDVYIMSWEIKGNVAVANREAVIVDAAGNYLTPVMPFKSSAMATDPEDITSIDQLVPLYIAPITDPCGGSTTATCTEPIRLSQAVGSEYSLDVKDAQGNASKLVSFYKMDGGKLTLIDPVNFNRKIGAGGVDTIYATIPFNQFKTSQNETVVISVKDSPYKATLSFFVPTITFVESETSLTVKTSDPDNVTHLKSEEVDFYLLALDPTKNNAPCGEACNFTVTAGSELSKGLELIYGPDSKIHVVNGRATVSVKSSIVYEIPTTATLHVKGPSATLMQAKVTNLQFVEPPVPTPLFADIFDVHGELPTTEMNVPPPYFSMQTEYLDGIGDSLTIYYYRPFYKDATKDSLPDKIAVFWDEDEKDSVLFEKADILAGAVCGAEAGLADTLCLPRITLGGKKLSKKVKTSGKGKLKSWATYMARGTVVTNFYSCAIYDRIAPIIVGARAKTETESAKLKIEFSEPIRLTTEGAAAGNKVFSFYINNGKAPDFYEGISLYPGVAFPVETATESHTLLYSQSTLFPQSGDYIHFGAAAGGTGYVADQSEYASYPGADSIRAAGDAQYNWNVAPGYDPVGTGRKPSPWVLISGEVSVYAVRLIPEAMGGIPKTPSEYADLDAFEVYTYDANKDDENFRNDILAGQTDFGKYGYVPHGWFVKSDMGALIESDEKFVNVNKKNVYFEYELQFFTNLGSFVAKNTGRIYCDDDENMKYNRKYYFGGAGKNCVENRRNIFILWNMKSEKNRLVGSGAYITKLNTFVQLDNEGKKNKLEKSEVWGVRHNAKTFGSLRAKLHP